MRNNHKLATMSSKHHHLPRRPRQSAINLAHTIGCVPDRLAYPLPKSKFVLVVFKASVHRTSILLSH